MPRYQPYSNPRINDRELRRAFYLAVAGLTSVDEVANFLKDLLSVSEVTMLSRRLRVAALLIEEKTYDQIADELQAGKSMVAQVQRWLDHGHNGYRTALTRLAKAVAFREAQRVRRERERHPGTLAHLQRRYRGRLIDPSVLPEILAEAQEVTGQIKRRWSVRRATRSKR